LLLQSSGSSADTRYLQTLRTKGLGGQFASDAVAVAHGHAVCTGLKGGAPAQGTAADQVAVSIYCSAFASGFHVLEKADVTGTFTLRDTSGSIDARYDLGSSSIAMLDDGSCTGIDGYDDIGAGTAVVVKDGNGHTITTTELGNGTGNDAECVFSFDFTATEGPNDYVVSVSHRGESHFTFTQLQNDGVHLSLGS
jgi:hypothetical protein